MKKNKLYIMLILEALVVAVLYILARNASYTGASLISFPFGFIGDMLRRLSLCGGILNVISIGLYALICVSPLAVLVLSGKADGALPEKIVLGILSPVLFWGLYAIINPTLSLFKLITAETMVSSVMAVTIDSFILLYVILRLVRVIRGADKDTLYKYLKGLMAVTAVITVGVLSVRVIGDFIYMIPASEGGLEIFRLILKAGFDGVNLLLTLFIALWVIKLTDTLSGDESALARVTGRLCSLCCASLIMCALSSVVLNAFNALFIDRLNVVDANLYIPITEISFSLIILLLTRLLAENKELREDNELFI